MKSVKLDPRGPFKRDPLPPQKMNDRLTGSQDVIVLCHLGVAHLEKEQWSLTIDGMLDRPHTLQFDDLLRFPKNEIESVHQCCGSPLAPFTPTRRVSNVRWGGVRLADILAGCQPDPAARYIWSYGADYGEFNGVAVDAYLKDLPMARVESDVLIAYEMNGTALTDEHGFPARLVVPGFYGTNSVKWLTRMTLAETRAPGPFSTRWYNDPLVDGAGRETGESTPVWAIAPESLIVSPALRETINLHDEREIWGWAWADGGVRSVYVRVGDTAPWQPAELEPQRGREWQRFFLSWTPQQSGRVALTSLAESMAGQIQATAGRRNAAFTVQVNVT